MRTNDFSRSVGYVLTTIMALIFILLLIWAVWTSVAPASGTSQVHGYGFGNYKELFSYGFGLPTYLKNSLIISIGSTLLALILCATGGYAFARFNFRGRNSLFVLVLSVMMVPYAALLIPLLVWLKDLRLDNSLAGVVLVMTLFQIPFGIFMMRNSFSAIPKELEEAAEIDGCGPFKTFWTVMLPTVKPGLVTVGLFVYLAAWNDFMISLYLFSSEKAPLPLALVNMRQQAMGVIDFGVTTAGVVVLTVPAVILFLALQRYYIKGFTSGAVKG
jgi:multiple sugar transport system permease protein